MVLLKPPKTMSEALLRAVETAKFHIIHGQYLETSTEKGHIEGCAKGAMYAMCVPWRTAIAAATKHMGDESMIKVICKNIKGACDVVPWEIWIKHAYDKGELDADDKKGYKQDYLDGIKDAKENDDELTDYRWVDLAEAMFESRKMDFKEIAAVFKKLGR